MKTEFILPAMGAQRWRLARDSVPGKRLVFGPDFETILECYEHNDRSERILDEAGRLIAAAPNLLHACWMGRRFLLGELPTHKSAAIETMSFALGEAVPERLQQSVRGRRA